MALQSSIRERSMKRVLNCIGLFLFFQLISGPLTSQTSTGGAAIVNLALHKPATQSSVYRGTGIDQGPQFGNDGILESQPRDPFLLVITDPNDTNLAWWRVDLQGVYALTQLKLYNRKACCQEKAKTVQVLVSADGAHWERAYAHNGTPFDVLTVDLTGRKARYVRLQLTERGSLQFQECEVYGYVSAPPVQTAGSQPSPQFAASSPSPEVSPAPSSGQTAAKSLTAIITPATVDIESGGKVDLWAKVSGGVPPYSYEWRNGESLSKVTAASITYSNLNRLGGRDIRLTVKDSTGNSADAHATFMVHAAEEIVASSKPPATSASSPAPPNKPSTIMAPSSSNNLNKPTTTAAASTTSSTKPVQKPMETAIEDSRRAGNASLQKIAAIKVADECSAKVAGAPWGNDAKAAQGTVRLEAYRASVAHALRSLKVVYGKMTSAQAASLDKMWAPFYDNPTPAAADWFAHLNPLLDDYIATAAALEENFPAFQESMSDVLVALGEKSRTLYAVSAPAAAEQYQALDAARKRLTQLASSIAALGDAPNPLASECTTRARHAKALGGGPDIWSLLHQALYAGVRKSDIKGDAGDLWVHGQHDTPSGGLKWNGNAFTYSSSHAALALKGDFTTLDRTFCDGVSSKSELLGELSKDGSELLSLSGYVDACDCTEGSVANNTCKAWGFRRTNVDARGIHAKLYKEKPVPGGSQHVRVVYTNANRALDLDSSSAKLQEGEFYLQFSNYIPIGFNTEALILVASSIFGKPAAQDSAAKTPPNANPENQTPSQAGTDSLALAAKEQAEATAEAIAEHQALAKQYEENAARWAADAANEKDPARREELQKRALEIRANASAERDIASSLSTGEFVRTRTDWDDQQQQRLVTKIHDELAQFDEAHRKQVEQLRAQKAEEMRGLVAQQKQAEEQLATVETELSAAETVQQGATMAMTIGALAVPGAGEVAMAYSVGTGYVEGGAPKAIETTVRMYSPYMDAAFSAYDGWKQIDPETGKQGGAFGALKGAAWNVVTNQAMSAIGERLQGAVARISTDAAATGSAVKPPADIEAFHTTEQRFEEARQNARTPEELADVNKQFDTIRQRQEMKQRLNDALSEADSMAAAARRPDGSVDTARPEYKKAVEHLNAATEKVQAEYSGQENRDLLHEEALEAAGLTPNDVILSGSKPKNALSDMDVSANTFAAGKAYTEALSAKGLKVQEFGDRWVVSNDTTVWKPAAADAVGSSSYEAQVIHGASRGSDKFATQAGQDFTKGQDTGDQLGPVIDNFKKAGEAGLGGEGPKDMHVIGKSADKALGVAKTNAPAGLRSKLSALRDHQLPEQAGILTLGASKEFKAKEMDSFLGSTEQAMGEAYKAASKSSTAHEADLVAQKQSALQNGDAKTASAIQRQLAVVRTDNRLAFATISDYAPELMSTLPPPGGAAPRTPVSIGGWTPLLQQLNADRADEGKATVQFNSNDLAFKGLSDRCKSVTATVDEKLKAAKPGTDEAKYLADLKTVLQQGVSNPGLAVQQTRQLTGYELAEVLKQLGENAK